MIFGLVVLNSARYRHTPSGCR